MSERSVTQEMPWDGDLHGRRYTGIGMVKPYTHEETNAWLESLNLPPLRDGETIDDWKRRVDSDAPVAQTELNQSDESPLGGQNG